MSEALKKLVAKKKTQKQKVQKEEKKAVITTSKKQTDLIIKEEEVMRTTLKDIVKISDKKNRLDLLNKFSNEKNAFFTRKQFISKFKTLSLRLQDDFIKNYLNQPQKYSEYYDIWFGKEERKEQEEQEEEDEEEQEKEEEQIKSDSRYEEIKNYIYNNALEYAKNDGGIEITDNKKLIEDIINSQIISQILLFISEHDIDIEADFEKPENDVKIILKKLLSPLKKALKKVDLDIKLQNDSSLQEILNDTLHQDENQKLVKDTLNNCKEFLNFLTEEETEYKDILSKVNYIIDHPEIFLVDIKKKYLYRLNKKIYGIYIDISYLLNISEPEKLTINELSRKISKKESLYFSRDEFLSLKNDKELLISKAKNLGLDTEQLTEIDIIKILLANSRKYIQEQEYEEQKQQEQEQKQQEQEQKQQEQELLEEKKERDKEKIKHLKINEKAVLVGKDFLSKCLLKVSPYTIDYKPQSVYINNVLKAKIEKQPEIEDFFMDIASLCVYMMPEKAKIFRQRIKSKYYIPEILLELSPFEKLPEIYLSDNYKAHQLFSSYLDNMLKTILNDMINFYITNTEEEILKSWKTDVIDFTKRKPTSIENYKDKNYADIEVEKSLLLESEYLDYDLYSKCENKQDVINEPIHNLVYYDDESDKKMYCFKITDLVKNLKENKILVNQYNGVKLSDTFVTSIKNKYNIYYEDVKDVEKKINNLELITLQEQHKSLGLHEIKLVIPNLWDLVNQSVQDIEESLKVREEKDTEEEEKDTEEKQEKASEILSNIEKKKENDDDSEEDTESLSEEEKPIQKLKKDIKKQLYVVKYKDGTEKNMLLDETQIEKMVKKDKNKKILYITNQNVQDVNEQDIEETLKVRKQKQDSESKEEMSFGKSAKCCVCGKEKVMFKSVDYNGSNVQQLNFCSTNCMAKKHFKKLKR